MKIAFLEKGKSLAEKQEFYAIDFFRLIAAFMVIAIHYPPFENVSHALSGGFSNILCRIAVPFFFLISGYFLGERIKNSEKTKQYIKKLVRFYLIYSAVYLPLAFYGFKGKEYSAFEIIVRYLRGLFLTGSYSHLWYFIALIVSVGLLFLLVNKIHIGDKALVGICCIIYFLGVLGCLFETELRSVSFLKVPIELYFDIFDDTKNGLFFGFPFISLGYILAKNRARIEFATKHILLLILFAGIMCAEKVVEMALAVSVKQDMMISMMPTACLLFLCLAFVKLNNSSKNAASLFRKMSVLIYVWHPLIGFIVEKVSENVGYQIHSIVLYLSVLIISVGIALATIKLSERFKILKQLY